MWSITHKPPEGFPKLANGITAVSWSSSLPPNDIKLIFKLRSRRCRSNYICNFTEPKKMMKKRYAKKNPSTGLCVRILVNWAIFLQTRLNFQCFQWSREESSEQMQCKKSSSAGLCVRILCHVSCSCVRSMPIIKAGSARENANISTYETTNHTRIRHQVQPDTC